MVNQWLNTHLKFDKPTTPPTHRMSFNHPTHTPGTRSCKIPGKSPCMPGLPLTKVSLNPTVYLKIYTKTEHDIPNIQ